MDDFRSTIYHLSCVAGVIQGLDTIVHDGSVSVDEVDFQPQEIGWTDGGLEKLLIAGNSLRSYTHPLYFRGTAMFSNIDDAKNDYLMTPEPDYYTPQQVTVVQHQPFGMVLPHWFEPSNGIEGKSYLGGVTIILFWQPLNGEEPFPSL